MKKDRKKYIINLLDDSIYLLRQNKNINVFEKLIEIKKLIEKEKDK